MDTLWIGVALGILGSLRAAYLKPWIDRLGGAFSGRWEERTAAKAKARTAMIRNLRENPHEQVMVKLEGLTDNMQGLMLFAVAGFFIMFSVVVVGFQRTLGGETRIGSTMIAMLAIGGTICLVSGALTMLFSPTKDVLIEEAWYTSP